MGSGCSCRSRRRNPRWHSTFNRRHGIVRRQMVTDAAAQDVARLRQGVVDSTNTASDVWADTAIRRNPPVAAAAVPC